MSRSEPVPRRGAASAVAAGRRHFRRWSCAALLATLAAASCAAGPSREFVVAAMCVMPKRWDKEENFARLDRWARVAAAGGAHLVITPECFLDGYAAKHTKRVPPGGAPADHVATEPRVSRADYLAAAETSDGPLLRRIQALARKLRIFLAVGFTEKRGEGLFNSVLLLSPQGEAVLRYAKTHNAATHETYNSLGDTWPVIDTPHGRWGALICYDRQLPETARLLALQGADLIMIPSFGGYSEINDALIRTRAYENGVWVAFVHPQRALIVAPDGKVVAENRGPGDQLVFATIARDPGPSAGAIRDRRPEIYEGLVRPQPAAAPDTPPGQGHHPNVP